MDPLFPELPEDLSSLSDAELAELLREHQVVAELIENEDEEFLKGMSADQVIAVQEEGVEQIETIVAEQKARKDREAEYLARKTELAERRKAVAAAETDTEGDDDADDDEGDGEEEVAEQLSAETETEEVEESEEEETEEVPAAVVASAEVQNTRPQLRRPPTPSRDRLPAENSAVLTAAAGLDGIRGGQVLDRMKLAEAMRTVARRLGPPAKSEAGIEQRFFIGQAVYPFPEERRLQPGELDANTRKIQAVIPPSLPGVPGNQALVASGGLCAPLEVIYTMPNFASQARPVRDALPSFAAERGGVNVPTATVISDITTAISVIDEAEDTLGGTFATKSCQDLTCPAYTETAVTVIAHCREYGNLNARAWPEKIAHENDLTMAAHARTAEQYLLDRIKALSINVTYAADLGIMADFVDAVLRAQAGIRYRLRMTPGSVFRVLVPEHLREELSSDWIQTQFDRVQPQESVSAMLERYRINVSYYMDAPSTGAGAWAAEAAGTLDDFPTDIQWAIFPEGEFIHVDGGTLDLGLVRDSTLNSTNDFQIFGETFENVARIGPAQGALWVTQTGAATGEVRTPGT
jgi:hypothetical protein